MEEIYKEVPYSKKIYVSNYGNIKKICKNNEVKILKKYLMGPKGHQKTVFTADYYGVNGYHPKLELAYVVAYLFLNNTVDYRYVKIAHKDGDPLNCRADNLLLYEENQPLTIQFMRGCILPEKIYSYKNNLKNQYTKRKENKNGTKNI